MKIQKRTFFDIIIALCVIVVIGAFVSAVYIADSTDKARKLENVYQKSFYDVSDSVNNIEVKLSKFMAAGTDSQYMMLAGDIWRQASMTADNLSQLPLDHDHLKSTTKFINQLGDISYSLSKKLEKGGKLSEEDEQRVEELYGRCRAVNEELRDIADKIGRGWLISDHVDRDKLSGAGNGFSGAFDEMEKMSVDYPKMIYDGPFSDNVKEKTYKAVESLPEIDESAAREKIAAMLSDYGIKKIEYLGNANGDIRTYEYSVTGAGQSFYVQMTIKGGMPVMISADRDVRQAVISNADAIKLAEKFIGEKAGFKDMKGVWVNRLKNTAYVNLVYRPDGVSYYPDMAKVKIALDDGSVIGFEAYAYSCNHYDRTDIPAAGISEAEARQKVSKKLDIKDADKAVIPIGGGEVFVYQFYCEYSGLDYIVYIDAQTGEEADILRVIDKDQGNLIM